jgi:hypothetical protein
MVVYGAAIAVVDDVEQIKSKAHLNRAQCNQSPRCGIFIRTQTDN